MAHFIFSNEKYLELIAKQYEEQEVHTQALLARLGVKPRKDEVVTLIIVAVNAFDGHDALFDLQIEAEKHFGKTVDMLKVRHVVVPSIEALKKSPHLERASFIMVLGEDLLGLKHYPELEDLLPFVG